MSFFELGYESLLVKLGLDESVRKNVKRVVDQMRRRHGAWVKGPSESELRTMFPEGWDKKNPSWQAQLEKSEWLKSVNSEASRRTEAKKSPFGRAGRRPPPPPGGSSRRPGTPPGWDDFWKSQRRQSSQHADDAFKRTWENLHKHGPPKPQTNSTLAAVGAALGVAMLGGGAYLAYRKHQQDKKRSRKRKAA
jgi:LPXTG-motif cell wall-anchored protein